MILPINSNSNSNYIAYKNFDKKGDYSLIGKNAAMQINTDLDYKRKIVEQQERQIFISGLTGIIILGGMFVWNLKTILELFKNKKKTISANIRQFESLKNNSSIPTIEDCKTLNIDLKNVLKRQVNQLKADNNLLKETGEPKASNRILLYGTPGTGKSFFSKIFAKSIDAEYLEVMNSDYNSMWAGEGVQNFKSIFETILKTAENNPNKRYVVTFNEIDAMLAPADKITEKTKGTHWVSILEERSVFLNYLEMLKERTPNVTIIGTTNISPKNNKLDSAAISRFQNLIEVPLPNKDCLYEALKMNLNKIKSNDSFVKNNDEELKSLAQRMEERKFSFRNLEYVVNEAKSYHLEDKINGNNNDFKFEYLKKAETKLQLSDGELSK